MKEKRGQLDISFGMIFSIIIIIAIIAVSFYVIQYFTKLSTCTSTGLFYEALEKEVNAAREATTSRQLFSADLPKSVDYLCIGNMTLLSKTEDKTRFDALYKIYRLSNNNVFVYPQNKGCQTLNSKTIDYIETSDFFCVKSNKGRVSLLIQKDAFDRNVRISSQ